MEGGEGDNQRWRRKEKEIFGVPSTVVVVAPPMGGVTKS